MARARTAKDNHELIACAPISSFEKVGKAAAERSTPLPILHLTVGLPGSGKTTRAEAIKAESGALRLTPDEGHIRLFGDDHRHPGHHRRHGTSRR